MKSFRLTLPCAALLLAACASNPVVIQQPPQDPLENFNRSVTSFNDTVDRYALKPVAKAYRSALPEGIRTIVGNFFSHWTYPTVIVNDVLQGKLGQAGRDTGRFALNTVMGVGGLFDVAAENGLPENNEDLGQTLATWGVASGPYIVLPLLGPSTVRDTLTRPVDRYTSPLAYYIDDENLWELQLLQIIDLRAGLLPLEEDIEGAYDPYIFLRDAWIQRRNFLIFDGDPPVQDAELLEEDLDYEIDL